jgi:HTH-type transcriptional regulator, repressor for puuD
MSQSLAQRIGAAITRERERQKLQQKTVAKRAGLANSSLSYIESGQRLPSLTTLMAIAKVLGVDVSSLIEVNS